MSRCETKLALCLLAIFFLAAPGFSQAVAVAGVSGTVTDSSGAALPGAQVSMTETGKAVTRTTITDEIGHYAGQLR